MWFPSALYLAGWVATLLVAAITAAAFTAQGIYAPNRGMDEQRYTTGTYLTASAWSVAQAINDVSPSVGCCGQLDVWAWSGRITGGRVAWPWCVQRVLGGCPTHAFPPHRHTPPMAQTATRDAVLAQIMALPNWNASSPDWKPLLYLNEAVAAQQAALQGFGAPVCGSTPAGTVNC